MDRISLPALLIIFSLCLHASEHLLYEKIHIQFCEAEIWQVQQRAIKLQKHLFGT